MMIKFLRHGTGSAAGAARYVLADTDHLGALREGVKTLRGNAEIFSAIADSCGFKQRYTSGVIAFAPEDDPTEQEIQDVLDSFEELAFAGLEKDDYHLFAVQHDEPNGSKHIHILVPRVHLGTKKSLNIAPPNHSSVFYPWRDFWNESKGWASPKDPARRRRLGKTRDGFLLDKQKQKKGLKLEKDEREFIVDSIEQGIRAGKIKNRADVESFLKNEFLTDEVGVVSRVVKNSISVRLYENGEDSKLGKAMRLTGAFFDAGFDAESWLAVEQEKEQKGQPSQRPKKAPDQKVVQELELRVDEILRLRAGRQSQYYAYEREDIKGEDKLDLSTLIKKRSSDDITDSKRASNVSALRARVEDQYRDIRYFTEVEDELHADVRELTNRTHIARASISESSRQIADVTSRITDVKSAIQEQDNRIRDVRARLVVVDNQLSAQHETHKDALLTLFAQTVQAMSYAQLNAAQLDLEPLLSSLVESQNIKTRDSVSLVKLFINSNEEALQDALNTAYHHCTDELFILFKDGIQPNPEPINSTWVKENLFETLKQIAKEFDYELDAESIKLFVAAHQADLIKLVDVQDFDFDRPAF